MNFTLEKTGLGYAAIRALQHGSVASACPRKAHAKWNAPAQPLRATALNRCAIGSGAGELLLAW